MKTVIVIPARLASTRLPNKLILDLEGKSIIERVYNQCLLVENVKKVIIAVDDKQLLKHCNTFCKAAIMTSPSHQSGTDRIAEAVSKIDCDTVINVQGDEPFIDPQLIESLINTFLDSTVNMASAKCKINTLKELNDPNNVKVITDSNDNAIYFSRLPIPYNREGFSESKVIKGYKYYKHLGIYGYTKDFLLQYSKMKPTFLEQTEKLEQLRVIENGFSIKMVETMHNAIGIDTLEDYEKAKELLKLK